MFPVRTLSRVPKSGRARPCLVARSRSSLASRAIAQTTRSTRSSSPAPARPLPLSRSTADLVVIDAATIARSSADSLEDLLRREAGMQLVAHRRPRPVDRLLHPRREHQQHARPDRRRARSARRRSARPSSRRLSLSQIDHIEVLRGPASSLYGADGGRRRGADLHPSRQRCAAHHRGRGVRALRSARPTPACRARKGRSTTRSRSATTAAAASRRSARTTPFGYFNPDDDGFSRNTGNLRLGYTPATGHRIGVNVLEATAALALRLGRFRRRSPSAPIRRPTSAAS